MKHLLTTLLSAAMCLLALSATAQERWITGRVTDTSGAPVVGATVTVEGSHRGAVTDQNGNYRIQSRDNVVLVFQCLGYERTQVKAGTKSVIDVEMEESIMKLDDVVVTGYQTISKERATGSFDIIDKSRIEKPSGNIASRLIGSAAGLTASQDAYGNPIFEIRGRTSFSDRATQPLLVVDGFAIDGGFESINPNDVESVTVLKDAAAASIWGAKSANGVIVITTKNAAREGGGAGNASVTVDYSGFLKISPKLDLDYVLSQSPTNDVIDYEVNNYGRWDFAMWDEPDTEAVGGYSQVYELLRENRLGHISKDEMNAKINALRNNDNRDQLRKYFLQNPIVHQENISINIATDKSQSSFSALYQNDREHYKLRNSNKYMINARNKTSLFKWLDLSFNGTYTYLKKDNSGTGLPSLAPYEMITDENGDPIPYGRYYSLNYLERHVPTENFPYSDWSWNPLTDLTTRDFKTTTSNARIQAGLTFKIWKGLTFESRVQYEMSEMYSHNYSSEDSYMVRMDINTASTWDRSTGRVTPNLPAGGELNQSRTRGDMLTVRNQINFNHTFADKHSIAFVAGLETIDSNTQIFSFPTTYGYNDETLQTGTFAAGELFEDFEGWYRYLPTNNIGYSYFTDRYFSAFGNLSYTFDNRYTVSGSARTDASNLITDDPAYRYAPFWSVGGSWQIANEKFMDNVRGTVDKLTVRLTYGHNGNVDKWTSFKPLVSVSSTPNQATGEMTGSMDSYGNPSLRWERTRTWNAGIDFSLWRGKLYGKIDVYDKHSVDLIANVSVPSAQGAANGMRLNNGQMSNRGFELELGSAMRISKNVTWTGALTLSYNTSSITALEQKPTSAYQLVYYSSGSKRDASRTWMEGYDINSLWMYKYGGVQNAGSETSVEMKPTIETKDGEHIFFDTWPTGDPMNISYHMGTTVAPWHMALSTSFRIYDFDLSLIITGKFGHKFVRESFNYPSISGYSIPNDKYSEILNCDPNQRVPLPQTELEPRYYFWDRFYPYMSYLVESASHLRLQEFNVTYNVPLKKGRQSGVRAMQVFLQCNNPFSVYFNEFGEDPEFAKGSMRLQASYTLGIKCKF